MTQEDFKDEARRLRPHMLRVARRYLTDDDAEDTVQDALLRLWQMRDQLRIPLDGLASVLVRNLAVSFLRRQQPEAVDVDLVSDNAQPEDVGTAQEERFGRLMAIIETLPPMQQTILRMRHMEGMEMADMAALIGSSEAALRKALSRARQAVKQQYLKRYEQRT